MIKNKYFFFLLWIFTSLIAFACSGFAIDWVLIGIVLINAMLIDVIYGILVRRRWTIGVGIVVDENKGERLDAMFMRMPILIGAFMAVAFLTVGRLFV